MSYIKGIGFKQTITGKQILQVVVKSTDNDFDEIYRWKDADSKDVIRVIQDGYIKTDINQLNKPDKDKKETINKMGKYFKHPVDTTIKVRIMPPLSNGHLKEPIYHQKEEKEDSNMVNIENLRIGQVIYNGTEHGEIIAIYKIGEFHKENAVRVIYGIDEFTWPLHKISLEPQFDFSNLETVKTLHYELWDWLEKNPTKTKEEWPRWENNGGDVPDADGLCFYCSYDTAHKNISHCCGSCPGDWKADKPNSNEPYCVQGAFGIYKQANDIMKFNKKASNDIKLIKSRAALIIKNS